MAMVTQSYSFLVQLPSTRTWSVTYGSKGALEMLKGCHSKRERAGTQRKTYLCGGGAIMGGVVLKSVEQGAVELC